MSSTPGSDYKSQVLNATDIVDLIGRTVSLKRAGKDYKGLCPFHQEKSPSFSVSPARQFFYCYGCKASGNAIDFVMKRDRIEFLDALKSLGEIAGIEMPRYGATKEKQGEKQTLLDANSAACMFFEKTLVHPQQGEAARAYLQKRGIDDESIKRFRIGLSPDGWDLFLKSQPGRKFTPGQLAVAGLAKPRNQGEGHYDTFRNRLMFPIRDENGRVIAFGARRMLESDNPKYLNSPETPLFSKGSCVYGLDLARQKIVESRTVVVVEGYTDVVMAHQFGASNVVSVLGTAMTEQHVIKLKRFLPEERGRIVLLFDADAAGDTAVDRTVGLFLTQPVEIAIASMPEGIDPDEFLLKEGLAGFEKMIAEAPDALTYKWKQLARKFGEHNDLTGQQRAVEQYLEVLASARGTGPVDGLRWGGAITRVSRLTGIPVADLNKRFATGARKPIARPAAPSREQSAPAAEPQATQTVTPRGKRLLTAQDRAELWLLGALLIEPKRWNAVQAKVSVADFLEPAHRRLAKIYWQYQRDEGEPVFNEFIGVLDHPSLVELAIEAVDEVTALAESDLQSTVNGALEHLAATQGLREQRKLEAELRRSSPGGGESPAEGSDPLALLRKLQEKARQPELRRRA